MAPRNRCKEWAVVVHALLEGEQILDVRKGGLREDGRHFSVQSTRFWLYPTAEHQKAELLKEPYRHWIDLAHAAPVGEPITIEGWADVVKVADRHRAPSELDAIASKLDLDRPTTPRRASAGRPATPCGCWRCGCTGCSSRSPCRGTTATAAAPRGSSSPASPTTPRRCPSELALSDVAFEARLKGCGRGAPRRSPIRRRTT